MSEVLNPDQLRDLLGCSREHEASCECPACGALRVFKSEYSKNLAANPVRPAPTYISIGWATIYQSGAIKFTKYKGLALLRSVGRDCEVRECFVLQER